MTRRGLAGVGLLAFGLAAAVGCDEPKKEPAPQNATAAPASSAPVASAAASEAKAPEAAPKKKERGPCPTGPEVVSDDAVLMDELRLKLQKKPDAKVMMSDLGSVRSLNLTKAKQLDELDPCLIPKLTSLHHLYLGPGELSDLSPIAGLVQLESLRASINHVADLKPLEKLTKLDRLDLGRTRVRDLSPVGKLVNLTELQLDDTSVDDIGPLAACTKLEKLSIKRTTVRDVSPLKGHKKLKYLYVEGSAVQNLDALQPLVARGLKVVQTGGAF